MLWGSYRTKVGFGRLRIPPPRLHFQGHRSSCWLVLKEALGLRMGEAARIHLHSDLLRVCPLFLPMMEEGEIIQRSTKCAHNGAGILARRSQHRALRRLRTMDQQGKTVIDDDAFWARQPLWLARQTISSLGVRGCTPALRKKANLKEHLLVCLNKIF